MNVKQVADRLNAVNGSTWRPFVGIFIAATLASVSALTWKVFDLQQEYYQGQERQNERLSQIEANSRAQAQFVDLADMLDSMRRTEFKVGRIEEQMAEIMRRVGEISDQQQRRDRGPTGMP